MKARFLALALLAFAVPALAQTYPPIRMRAGTAYTIVTGGTAIIAVTGPVSGCYIYNPNSSTDQGISAVEDIFVDPANGPALVGTNTTSRIGSGQAWFCGAPVPSGFFVRVNAATSGHAFNVVVW